MAKQQYYEGQEFVNPDDPRAPVLVYRKGKFVPKTQDAMQAGTAPQNAFGDVADSVQKLAALKERVNPLSSGLIGGMTAGDGKGLFKGIPGTPGYDLNRDLDPIRARIGFKNLADMRAASPTGGALGNVSEGENLLLQATEGNLNIGQSTPQLRNNLEQVRQSLIRKTPGVDPSNPIDLSFGGSRDQIPRGAYYRDSEGNVRRNENGDAGNPIVNKRAQKNNELKAKSAKAKGFTIRELP